MCYEDNPFYKNYLFTKKDLQRRKLTLADRLSVIFRPMYVQICEGFVVRFKTTADGRIFVFGFEDLPADTPAQVAKRIQQTGERVVLGKEDKA
jgi:1-acyl-sn-glycerol-3-phosphate acyltransferase